MKLLIAIILLAVSVGSANAQQAGDRVASQIGQLVIRIEQQVDQIKALIDQLAAKDAKIKSLEEKPECKVEK